MQVERQMNWMFVYGARFSGFCSSQKMKPLPDDEHRSCVVICKWFPWQITRINIPVSWNELSVLHDKTLQDYVCVSEWRPLNFLLALLISPSCLFFRSYLPPDCIAYLFSTNLALYSLLLVNKPTNPARRRVTLCRSHPASHRPCRARSG
jgi:hypothetical protein